MSMLPMHIALLPDGNRRWAKSSGVSRYEGHRLGLAVRLPEITDACLAIGIHTVTVYPFSTENWERSRAELRELMKVNGLMLERLLAIANKRQARIIHLGRRDRLPKILQEKLATAEKLTAKHKLHMVNIALDYGGRDEIIRAVAKLLDETKAQPAAIAKLLDGGLGPWLDTAGQPYADPDLIIRTAEQRLSGFMAYQSAYSELYFSSRLWPDFTNKDLEAALHEFSTRQRKYGK